MSPITHTAHAAGGGCTPLEHPLEYDAFCQMHRQPYLAYARLRTGDARRAAASVTRTFAALCTRWPETLRSACPAAAAWEILHTAVGAEAGNGDGVDSTRRPPGAGAGCATADGPATGPAPTAAPPHDCGLTAPQADAVRLHRHLGVTVQDTAALMGRDDHAVRALLRSADRTGCAARYCPLARG
jgi:hypothetical protein